jgi:transcriptional regulator of acetoin/glycerol metabolism
MQPSEKHPDFAHLKQAWETFVSTNRLLPNIEMDPLVTVSWQRCALRMNPIKPPHWVYESDRVFSATLNQHASLLNIARPILEDIYQYLEGCSLALALTDNTGCLIEILGETTILAKLKEMEIHPGIFLDEGRAGTNAVAIALAEGLPAQVVGPEHFLITFHDFCSVAAPIHELEGHPVGVIGIIEPIGQFSKQCFGIVVAGARAIENQLRAEVIVQEANTQTSELYATMDSVTEGILAWDERGILLHLNDQGGQIFNLSPSLVVGSQLAEHITLPEGLARAVARKEELSDVEVAFQLHDKQRECLVSLRVITGQDKTPGVFIVTLRRIEQLHQLASRLVGAKARLTLDDIVGRGSAARKTRKQALAAAKANAPVMIIGETGTGKNVLARAIHNSGNRAGGPFLAINCRAIPHKLALGEFLGYEPGLFSGSSISGQPSKFELAQGGTLFLEEIEALPMDTQAALQRVIEFNDVIRLGGTRVIPVDVRVIAATTHSIDELSNEYAFRFDLLLRLSSFLIDTVPLRDHPEDIPLLTERFLERLKIQMNQSLTITPAAQQALCEYPWPGNNRELETVIERAAQQCDNQPIDLEHLPAVFHQRRVVTRGTTITEPVRSLAEAERISILNAGRAAHGNLSETARLLKIGRTTLWRKMKEFKISSDEFD